MTIAASRPLLTADDLLKLPDDGKRYELVRGELVCMAAATLRSSIIGAKVATRLTLFVEQHPIGECGISEGGFKLAPNPDIVRVPDVWFVRAERVPAGGFPDGIWEGFPDLAVEVLSPTDRPLAVAQKVQEYLDAGTRLVWVLDPDARAAAVYRPGHVPVFLDENGILDGEDVLSGFTLPLRDVLPSLPAQ